MYTVGFMLSMNTVKQDLPLCSTSFLLLPKPPSISLAAGLSAAGRAGSGTFNPSSFPSDSRKSPATSLFRAALAASARFLTSPGNGADGWEGPVSSSSSSESSENIAWQDKPSISY